MRTRFLTSPIVAGLSLSVSVNKPTSSGNSCARTFFKSVIVIKLENKDSFQSSNVLNSLLHSLSSISFFLQGAMSLCRMIFLLCIQYCFDKLFTSSFMESFCSWVNHCGRGPMTSIHIEYRFKSVFQFQVETPACQRTWEASQSLYTSQLVSTKKCAETCLHVSQRRVLIFHTVVFIQVAVWWRTIYSQVFLSHFVKFFCRDVKSIVFI